MKKSVLCEKSRKFSAENKTYGITDKLRMLCAPFYS